MPLQALLVVLALVPLLGTEAGAQDTPVFREEGEASYYADGFQGEPTASGEPYDRDALTAAHPELPLGSEVTVTEPESGREVTVEINDRGPHADDRVIDLSRAAAEQIGIVDAGVAEVEIEATGRQIEQAAAPGSEAEVLDELAAARAKAEAAGVEQPDGMPGQ